MPQASRAASSVAGGESCSPSNKAQDVDVAVERVATAVMDVWRWMKWVSRDALCLTSRCLASLVATIIHGARHQHGSGDRSEPGDYSVPRGANLGLGMRGYRYTRLRFDVSLLLPC
jgi:hypothetical protein